MKLNNKGYMLVEVIVASAIALVMAYFLVDITITLTNKNNDYYVESTLITDKNLITKEIMDDVNNSDYSLTGIKVNIEGDVTTATLDYKNINDNSTLERELIINKNTNARVSGTATITYANGASETVSIPASGRMFVKSTVSQVSNVRGN